MMTSVQSKTMFLLLPLLAACSGDDGQTTTAVTPKRDAAVVAQGTAQPTSAVAALSAFDVWANRLMADRISPVIPLPGDMSHSWIGADGRLANVVVRTPRTAGKPTVSFAPPSGGGDATPGFQAAIAQLKNAGGGILKVAPGDYRFKTGNGEQPGIAHILLSRLSDVDIRAVGANFIFESNLDAIFIQDCQRLRLYGLSIRDARMLSGTGRIRSIDGVKTLELDQPLPAGGNINWVSAMNEGSARTWPYVQARTIIEPNMPQPVRVNDRTFTSSAFRTIEDGQYVSVKFSYYGTRAVYVRDSYTGSGEDIVLDDIHIGSVAGMGVAIKTRGRGLAIQNSTFAAEAGRPYGANYDGIHLTAAAGDILIRGNTIMHTGDDAMNLRSIIHKVTPTSTDGATLTGDARLIRVGDEVAFFNKDGEYLGTRFVATAPPLGNSDTVRFTFKPGEPFNQATFARVLNLTPRRFAVVGNTLADGPGHGMLIQIPNGLVLNNTIRRYPRTAIRMLTSFDPWLEGAGAINVRVSGNTIDDGGGEAGLSNYVTGIVTAVGEVIPGKVAPNFHNGPIRIDGNKFITPRGACIVIYNTKGIVQQNNTCG